MVSYVDLVTILAGTGSVAAGLGAATVKARVSTSYPVPLAVALSLGFGVGVAVVWRWVFKRIASSGDGMIEANRHPLRSGAVLMLTSLVVLFSGPIVAGLLVAQL